MRPPHPQKPLPRSGGEDSQPPAQGHFLSGAGLSPPPRAPPRVSRARPPRCSPSALRPLAGLGKAEKAAGPGALGLPGARHRNDGLACPSASQASRAPVSQAAAGRSATTSAVYFRQIFLFTSTLPSPRMRHAPTTWYWALPWAPPLKSQSGQK